MDKKTKVKKTIPDTICRVHRSGGYAVLSNCFVRSTNIGCDSIGLLGKINDLPPTWNTVGTGRSRSECQHIIQSFAPGEVTPERALLIGQELCKALFNDEYQYVLAVHVDHEHIHNHIILNNVNFYTGKTFETEFNLKRLL